MKLETIKMETAERRIEITGAGAIETRPFVRAALGGHGCTLENCNCSPGRWLSVSNGDTLFKITLTDEECEALMSGESVEITED